MDAPAPPQPPAPRPGGLGDFAAWPDELVVYLLAGLELRELLALSQASKLMRVLCCEEPMWAVRHLQACKRPFDYRVRRRRRPAAAIGALLSLCCCRCLPVCVLIAAACQAVQGSWRATFMAHHPACGRPALTAADLVPLAPVPGFSSPVLYRWGLFSCWLQV